MSAKIQMTYKNNLLVLQKEKVPTKNMSYIYKKDLKLALNKIPGTAKEKGSVIKYHN